MKLTKEKELNFIGFTSLIGTIFGMICIYHYTNGWAAFSFLTADIYIGYWVQSILMRFGKRISDD